MKLKPLNDHIILKVAAKNEITESGIIIPETVDKERPESAMVIAVGPGKVLENGQRAAMSVKEGDRVVFKKYSPDEIKIEKEEYLVISESDVMAIIE